MATDIEKEIPDISSLATPVKSGDKASSIPDISSMATPVSGGAKDDRESFIDKISKKDNTSLLDQGKQLYQEGTRELDMANKLPDTDPTKQSKIDLASRKLDSVGAYQEAYGRKRQAQLEEFADKPILEKMRSAGSGALEVAKEIPGAVGGFLVKNAVPGAVSTVSDIAKVSRSLPDIINEKLGGGLAGNAAKVILERSPAGSVGQVLNLFRGEQTPEKNIQEGDLAAQELAQSAAAGLEQLGQVVPATARGVETLMKGGRISDEDAARFAKEKFDEAKRLSDISSGKNNIIAQATGEPALMLDPEKVGNMSIFTNPANYVPGLGGAAIAERGAVTGLVRDVAGTAGEKALQGAGSLAGKVVGYPIEGVGRVLASPLLSRAGTYASIVGAAHTGGVTGVIEGLGGVALKNIIKSAGGLMEKEGKRLRGVDIPRSVPGSVAAGAASDALKSGAAATGVGAVTMAPQIAEAETPEEGALMLSPGAIIGGSIGAVRGGSRALSGRVGELPPTITPVESEPIVVKPIPRPQYGFTKEVVPDVVSTQETTTPLPRGRNMETEVVEPVEINPEALNALQALGIKKREATSLLTDLPGNDTQSLIRNALLKRQGRAVEPVAQEQVVESPQQVISVSPSIIERPSGIRYITSGQGVGK